jgi:hypothetical protein
MAPKCQLVPLYIILVPVTEIYIIFGLLDKEATL